MAKQGEIEYPSAIGEDGRRHAKYKPFSDVDCGKYLTDLGQIMRLLPHPPARILDLGCGTGWTSIFMARAGYDVIGRDIAPGMIALAEERRAEEGVSALRFETGDYEHLEHANEFDAVLFFDALHHSEDERAALAGAFKALRPGGMCIVSEPGAGHHEAESSLSAMKEFGVNERDMPPTHVCKVGADVGFSGSTVYPHPSELLGQAFWDPQGRFRKVRKILRSPVLVRAASVAYLMVFRQRHNGLTVLVK